MKQQRAPILIFSTAQALNEAATSSNFIFSILFLSQTRNEAATSTTTARRSVGDATPHLYRICIACIQSIN
jgi:hypothetical protein